MSIRSCGAKYAVCGPNTASGLPDSDSRADTSSAFEPPRGKPPSRPPSPGSARAAEAALGLEPSEDERAEEEFSEAVHWIYGTAWGVPRVFIDALGIRGRNADLLQVAAMWGTAMWMLPRLRVTPPPEEWGGTEIAIDALHHLVYALGAGAAYDVLKHV
jgi:hypothetical protein